MALTNELNKILSDFERLKTELLDIQEDLLEYCRDKSIPLDERWNIWIKYIDKIHHKFVWRGGNTKYIKKLLDYYLDDYVQKHETVDYDYLLYDFDFMKEDLSLDFDYDQIREEIIEQNFGSMVYDW